MNTDRVAAVEKTTQRAGFRVRGVVQGVGFRPFVYRLATSANLRGFVRNEKGSVWIEIEGNRSALEQFPIRLRAQAPRASVIDSVTRVALPSRDDHHFSIVPSSDSDDRGAIVPSDLATCDACVAELLDPANRRFEYPFLNCTDCGPRYSIVESVPYDRTRTTMQAFQLCAPCRSEYENPTDRRFHAEPIACAACGPRLTLVSPDGSSFEGDVLSQAVRMLVEGKILAIKGLGGFQLAVDAWNDAAVKRLRTLKHRPHQPFAVMARDLETASTIGFVETAASYELTSSRAPIVLLPRREGTLADSVAPSLEEIGVMLPSTPLHHLLLREIPVLVMTSGNRSHEPVEIDNGGALSSLGAIADAFLLHDRAIRARADDSVVRIIDGAPQVIRRARGYVPQPINLAGSPAVLEQLEKLSLLGTGAQVKNSICVTRGAEAFLSPHIGDLDSPLTQSAFDQARSDLSRLLGVDPNLIVHDLHPDYWSTRWALGQQVPTVAVQHHHAHIASCLAEHQRYDEVIGVAFDGTGCGPEGDAWGGEILAASPASMRRLAHLRPLAMIGGEAAIREPWRLALAALLDAGEDPAILANVPKQRLMMAAEMFRKNVRTMTSTSGGRWFDAIAALCGVRETVSYEAQAAIEFEAVASKDEVESYSIQTGGTSILQLDLRPMVREIVRDLTSRTPVSVISARFHETIAESIRIAAEHVRRQLGIGVVALSGGCFQNALLSKRSRLLLQRDGFEVLQHRNVPANDGGIALGQVYVAAHQLSVQGVLRGKLCV